jgi:hypothetical protein
MVTNWNFLNFAKNLAKSQIYYIYSSAFSKFTTHTHTEKEFKGLNLKQSQDFNFTKSQAFSQHEYLPNQEITLASPISKHGGKSLRLIDLTHPPHCQMHSLLVLSWKWIKIQ